MTIGLRLSLLLCIAGCASELLIVPDADWQTVPATQRAALDHQYDAELAAARTELTAATTSLAALRSTPPEAAAPHASDRAVEAARGRVETANQAWRSADLAWRQLRAEVAQDRIDVVVASRELVRAKAIDHNLPVSESYETAPLRGQLSQVQVRWYDAANRTRQARLNLDRASGALAAAKEAYAELMRGPSTGPAVASSSAAPVGRFELSGWTLARSDVRRRGRQHFADEVAAAPPQLRKAEVTLASRAIRRVGPPDSPDAVATGAPASKPASSATAAVPAVAAKPAPAAAATAPAVAAKPAPAAAATAPAVAAKPASAASAPAVASKPAPAASTTPTVATSSKPAVPATPTTFTGKPAAAAPASKPAAATSATKPVEAPATSTQ